MCDLAFETWKQFIKHNLSVEHLHRARKVYEEEVEDKTRQRVNAAEEDDYILKHKTITKDKTKDIIKTKPSTNAKTKTADNIYTRIKFECKECHKEFRKKQL